MPRIDPSAAGARQVRPTAKKRKPSPPKPKHASVYVQPTQLAPVEARRAAAVDKHPSKPNAVQRAHEQEQAYRAQGRAVRRTAATQRQQAPKEPHPAHGHGVGGLIASVAPRVKIVSNVVAALAGDKEAQRKALGTAVKVATHAPKDAAELAVTTPSSVVHLADTAIHHPRKLPAELVAPYKEFVKDPEKAITEHPVQTALMVAPAVRVPGLAAGRVARVAGKQTLERPGAVLPGTALKDARAGSRDVVVRAVQSHADRKHGAPTMTQAQLQRRVDEFHDFGKQHTARVVDSAAAQAKKAAKAKGLSKADVNIAVSEKVKGARGGAQHQVDERFGREFGAVHEITPQGNIVTPKNATAGALHASRDDAQRIADRLNSKAMTIDRGRHGPQQYPRQHMQVAHGFVVRPAGAEKYAVVPKEASARLHWHERVGGSEAPGSKIMRAAGRSFRTAVLPLSARWLTGQATEAGVRAAVTGSGLGDLYRFRKVVHRMNKEQPGSGDELVMRVTGGQFGLTGTAREFAEGKSLADEFHGTALEDIAHGLTRAGTTRPARAIRGGWGKYTNLVFNTVNGAFESTARKAMAGQAIRSGHLMERRVLGLSDRAIHDAAHGLQGTHAQVELGRAVDRMYGQYQKFSPGKRETLLHSTPFYPWYRNVVTFLTKTLPVDHPVKAALLADVSAVEEEWRKSHGLSLLESGGKPGFLLGGIPVGGSDRVVRVGRYTPFAPGDALGAVGDLAFPQFGDVKEILHGHDFTGKDVKGNRIAVAGLSLGESHLPGLAQLDRITGLGGRYVRKTDEPTVLEGKDLVQALRREVDPLISTRGGSDSGSPSGIRPVRIAPVRVKPIKVKPVKVGG